MQNREPTYPGRITLTPVAGLANTYDMDRADQPLQPGTPLTKDTFLKDSTSALFGLGTDAVPDDVLAELGKYKQYWWRRRVNLGYQEVKTNLTSNQIVTETTYYPNLQYAKRITMDSETGEYTLVNPTTVVCAGSKNGPVIDASLQEIVNNAPCYVKTDMPISGNLNYQLFYLPAGSTTGYANLVSTKYTIYRDQYRLAEQCTRISVAESGVVQAQGVSFVLYDPTHNAWEYLRSNSRSAYPDSGTSGGYEYEYLGIPFDNAVGPGTKIDVGNYVGTGTYGTNGKSTLTFSFAPCIVILDTANPNPYSDVPRYFMLLRPAEQYLFDRNHAGSLTWGSQSVTWNSDDAPHQFNESGKTYYYIAIG